MNRTLKTLAFQGVNFVLQVLFVFAAARLLGPGEQGAYALVRTSVFLVESLMWFGLSSGVTYLVAKDFGRYHGPLVKLSAIGAAVLLTLGLAVRPWVPAGAAPLWGLAAAWVASLAAVQFFQKVFLGQQRFDEYNWTAAVNVAAAALLLAGLAWRGRVSLGSLALCHVAANGAALALALFFHRAHLRRSDFSAPLPPGLVSEAFGVGIKGYLSSLAFLLLYRLDFYFVGYFLGAAALGVYSVAVFAVEAVQKVPDWLGMMLSPKIAASPAAAGALTRKFLKASLAYTGTVSALAFLGWGMARGLPPRLLGEGYAAAGPVALALLPRAGLHSAMVILAARLAGQGYTFYHPLAGAAALGVLALADGLFLKTHGVPAAVAAITAAYAVATFVMALGCARSAGPGGTPAALGTGGLESPIPTALNP